MTLFLQAKKAGRTDSFALVVLPDSEVEGIYVPGFFDSTLYNYLEAVKRYFTKNGALADVQYTFREEAVKNWIETKKRGGWMVQWGVR